MVWKVALPLVVASLSLGASARAQAASGAGDGIEADEEAPPAADRDGDRAARAYEMLPFSVSPRVGDRLVTGHFWGGYDGAARGTVGEAVVDGRISRFVALRVGASSADLYGRPTATLGARVGILRDATAPLDLGVGAFYQPQSIRGDGLVTGTVSLGKSVGRLSSQASFGYGQDPEGDDGLGMTSLGGAFRISERVTVGLQSRARFQLWSADRKFVNLEQPVMDFAAGPLLAYSVGRFDISAHGGLGGLMLKEPPSTVGEHSRLQLGPMMMLGVGASL